MSEAIVVIGAGLGGLTLAVCLQKAGRAVTVYERESGQLARNQGGSLDMHPEGGQRALKMAGLEEGFYRLARAEAEAMKVVDKTGRVYRDENLRLEENGGVPKPVVMGEGRPEFDRPALRQLLLDALAPGTVQWHKRLTSLTHDGARSHLVFDDGTSLTARVVVGADGAHSQVRPLVTPAVARYTGLMNIEVGVPRAKENHPSVARTVGAGSMMALDDEKGLIAQVNGDGRIRTYICIKGLPEDWVKSSGLPFTERPAEAKEAILHQFFSDWDPSLLDLVRCSDDMVAPRPIVSLPAPLRWERRVAGVTLIGDAAHVVPPNGEGANHAMLDGAELAEALAAINLDDAAAVEAAISSFEEKMFARGVATAAEDDTLGIMLGPGGAPAFDAWLQKMEAMFAEMMAAQGGAGGGGAQ